MNRLEFYNKWLPQLNGMPLSFEEFNTLCDEGRFDETSRGV